MGIPNNGHFLRPGCVARICHIKAGSGKGLGESLIGIVFYANPTTGSMSLRVHVPK